MAPFPIFITSFYILSKPWENKFTKCPVMASFPIFITSFNILSKPGDLFAFEGGGEGWNEFLLNETGGLT